MGGGGGGGGERWSGRMYDERGEDNERIVRIEGGR